MCAREAGRPGHRISLRVSDELFEAITELAKRERRPLTMWVRQRLEDAVTAGRPAGAGSPGPKKR